MFRSIIRLFLHFSTLIKNGRIRLLPMISASIGQEQVSAGAVVEQYILRFMHNTYRSLIVRIHFRLYMPVTYVKCITTSTNGGGRFIPVLHLHNEKESITTTVTDLGIEMPLVRISRIGECCRRYHKLVCL